MSEKEFCKRICSLEFLAICCVAAIDKADKRRVALALIPDTGVITVNFPFAKKGLNNAEKRLLNSLYRYEKRPLT